MELDIDVAQYYIFWYELFLKIYNFEDITQSEITTSNVKVRNAILYKNIFVVYKSLDLLVII